ncbi:MAG: threonine--tRNA ligase [Planctomycetota bacterium]|jgi:threonyl-tRNA synthetase|nr:threonine--tRNA ligase [Planctomycetota bacterium]MDP6764112.1 threonine--tRNA ligase [Planctomycetota bacterium]
MSAEPSAVSEADPYPLSTLRHSVAHLMASAVGELFPGVKYGFGPSIDHGFYYDFELVEPLTDADLKRIEKRMRKIARRAPELVCSEADRGAARERLAGQDFKLEALELIPEDEPITFYGHGEWEDLCEGPHIDRLDRAFAFKLLNIAGAYWRGDEKNPMLQRVYGTAFWSEAELDEHLVWLEEVRQRDHRRLGAEMDLFSTHAQAGSGFVFWHPALGAVRRAVEDFWWELHTRAGYEALYTPHVSREDLFAVSGHLENYDEMIYAPMEIDEQPYRVKPMNCPGHILVYQSRGRSYREFPLRWAELGTVYRYERSGTLHGMLRVRGFTQDDSHIFCTADQLTDELAGVLELVRQILGGFGFAFTAYLATRPDEKTIGSDEIWAKASDALCAAAEKVDMPLEIDEGGGTFYGPKIDFKMRDALGREWQTSTVQCDFNLPERFDLTYTDSDGERKRPIMVHRAILGSFERFMGVLIEHFGGRFPFWCAPTQVALIPIREEHAECCGALSERLRGELFRVDAMLSAGHMNKKIKEAQQRQVPFMLIVGDREVEEGTVTVRRRGTREQETLAAEDFLALVRELRSTRSLDLAL